MLFFCVSYDKNSQDDAARQVGSGCYEALDLLPARGTPVSTQQPPALDLHSTSGTAMALLTIIAHNFQDQ